MSDAYDYPDADAIPPVKPNATHALTREQVEAGMFTREQLDKALALIFHKGTPAMQEVVMEVLAHDGALRQALARHAQEVERLKGELKNGATYMRAQYDSIVKMKDGLAEQLAASQQRVRELEEEKANAEPDTRLFITVTDHERQLATLQATLAAREAQK